MWVVGVVGLVGLLGVVVGLVGLVGLVRVGSKGSKGSSGGGSRVVRLHPLPTLTYPYLPLPTLTYPYLPLTNPLPTPYLELRGGHSRQGLPVGRRVRGLIGRRRRPLFHHRLQYASK